MDIPKYIPHIEVPETSVDNNVHFDRYREVDGFCLLSFYIGEMPRRQWGLVVGPYTDTEWIIDEYRENWYLDESSVEYKFRHSDIYHNTGKIPLRTTYSTNVLDFLMEKYPVHFGCIKLEQLNREAEKKISTCITMKIRYQETNSNKCTLIFRRRSFLYTCSPKGIYSK